MTPPDNITPPRGPWDEPVAPIAAPQPAAVAAPVAAPASPLNEIVWAAISTLLLAAWIAWQMGWVWALAGVVGVFVHEFGHVLAINALGCGPGRIRIIPFLGGAATMARPPTSDFKSVLISLAGPAFGLLAAIPFFVLARIDDPAWAGGAFFIALINLINLAPAPPLDGSKALGPALARIHPMVERAALVLVGAGAVYWAITTGNWIFGAFVGIATLGAIRTGIPRLQARPLTAPEWLASVALWLIALALCLGVIVAVANFGALSARFR
ncbi:MAG TPA: M50 family metallopeptidase [Caulobacteraceae bacterium]|nr:M50 family metallopeptidase [Caulobacteraceae bacterium]